jgi:hypothetical protein
LVEANNLSTMFSLTFDTSEVAQVRTRRVVGDLSDWEQARSHFSLFRKRVKAWCNRHGFVYDFVAVSELQKRGVQHFHVATSLPLRHADLMALWGYGTVWVSSGRAGRRREKRRPGSEASYVASYISKYMGKDMVQQPGGQEPGDPAASSSVRGWHKSRYHRARSLKLPFEEYLLEPGDMTAFQQVLEEDGFEMVVEPRPIEKDGINFGWWARSVQFARESGDLARAPAPAEGGEDARARSAPHLKDGQVVTMKKGEPKKTHPEGEKEHKEMIYSARREARHDRRGEEVAPKKGGSDGPNSR